VKLVLEGLAGIIDVEMDLGKDAFTIIYDSSRIGSQKITDRIRRLGYRPEEIRELDSVSPGKTVSRHDIPEPVATALTKARKAGRFLLIDFYAAWCSSCKVIEEIILTDLQVLRALERYRILKVDTDQDVKPAEHFQVFVLPTLLVIDPEGVEVFRHVGVIDGKTLAEELDRLTKTGGRSPGASEIIH
jgi:thiol:disulfide interchange protein